MDTIEDLSSRWKLHPDPASTIALCDALRASPRDTLVLQVGEIAIKQFQSDARVLVAVARMYLEAQRLSEAQAVLVSAGKVSPRDGAVYRWLGEVLLRRGDAQRAEKVLERAMQLGASDGDTRLWLERSRVLKPVQAKAGPRAVAAEIAQAAPPGAPARADMDSLDDSTTSVRAAAYEDDEDNDDPTRIRPATADAKPLAPPPRAADGPSDSVHVRPTEVVAVTPPPMGMRPVRSDVPPRSPQAPPQPPPRAEAFAGAASPPPAMPPLTPPPSSVRGVPSPKAVLDALALAGLFEPSEAAARGVVRWDHAPTQRDRRRGSIALVFVLALFVGGGLGAYRFVRGNRAKARVQADAILQKVEADLDAGRAATLAETERSLGRAFEMDSRSPRAALDWLHERALSGLLKGGADLAFEDAMARARDVGVSDESTAFARVSSFLFQGDTAGAAALMPRLDAQAANEAWYQLMTGATLERVGDARAADRYAAAIKLHPALMVAEVALVRAMVIDGDPNAAATAKSFRTRFPDRAEGAALVALAWARDPARGEQAPAEVAEMFAHTADLPISLAAVPHALLAITAIDKHAFADAKTEIEQGLAVADGPGVASWLGSIALDTGDEPLVRKAALVAVSFSAVYPPARVLAARVALLGDRLDEALKATEELEASDPDVAIVRAAAAYERNDADALGRALEPIPADAMKLPFMNALAMAPDVLFGRSQVPGQKILEMSDDEAPWSDLVAMDLALDTGDLDVASKIAGSWKGDAKPLRAVRLSRLSRYEAKTGETPKLDAADALSKLALEGGTVTARTLKERVFVLVAKNRAGEVGPLLAKFPLVLGPLASWLSAYAVASAGKVDEARGKTSSLDPPPPLAPLASRVIAAAAFGAMKDRKRGVDYIKPLLAAGILDPDLVNAAVLLGFHKVEHRRRATFE